MTPAIEKVIDIVQADVEDELAGNGRAGKTITKGSGLGVSSVPAEARSYFEISQEDQRRELEAGRQGRWAAEAKAPLPPGEVPTLPSGSPCAAGNTAEPPLGEDINGADPSGVNRNRGVS